MTEPYYADDSVTLYLGDCRAVTEWQAAEVLVTDPPYGINLDTAGSKHALPIAGHRAIAGDAEPFDPAHLLGVRRKTVLWGANNYASRLPDSGAWIVWDKTIRQDLKVRIADAELAWTDCLRRSRTFHHLWSGAFRQSERGTSYHPSQKPVALMVWTLDLIAQPGDLVADPYAGSGPTLIAAKQLGLRAIGVELDERYCEIVATRLSQEVIPPLPPRIVETPAELSIFDEAAE